MTGRARFLESVGHWSVQLAGGTGIQDGWTHGRDDVTGLAAPFFFPTLSGYRRSWLGRDIVAGLSAGAVVIPQAMAYATIANLPVQVGLYTCIVPMLVYVFLGGSRAMSVSTTSTIATLTASTFVTAGVASASGGNLGSLVTLTLMVGIVLGALRVLKLSSLIENISSATILGVQVGVGATVAISQVPKMLGENTNAAGHGFIRSIISVVEAVPQINGTTVTISVIAILLLVGLKRFLPVVPGPLVVVVGSIVLVALTGVESAGVRLIDPVPQGLPVPMLPDLHDALALIPGALGIALMAFLESVAVAKTLRTPDAPHLDTDRELVALAAANALGSFFAVLPAAGGFSQSAVNRAAGARSQLSALTTVVLAVITALSLGPVLSLLPQAALAAIVFVAVAGLVRVDQLVRLARTSPTDFWVATFTAVIGLTVGLLAAVGAGVLITIILVLREINTPRLEIAGRNGSALAVHLGRGLYTANLSANIQGIESLVDAETEPVTDLVLDVERLDVITITILDGLRELDHDLDERGITLHLARLPDASRSVAETNDWFAGVEGAGRAHATVDDALKQLNR
jgi:MFS superfamily sulfate permease-like transporter